MVHIVVNAILLEVRVVESIAVERPLQPLLRHCSQVIHNLLHLSALQAAQVTGVKAAQVTRIFAGPLMQPLASH
jgi:hypothetical protein